MSELLRCVPPSALISGWDFSTGSVKALVFDLTGSVVAEVRLPTDLWTEKGVSELNLMQLEGQARASVRGLASALLERGRIGDWVAGGLSATHHSAGRIDADGNQVRRAVCWNDQTLGKYHAEGLARLGGPVRARELTGGPWAVRYSLSHLIKDEQVLADADWQRTKWIAQHGSLAAGYLTGRFDCVSISSAASTGILDLRTNQWQKGMLNALADPVRREQSWACLPALIDMYDPVGRLADHVAIDARMPDDLRPLIFPTLDDQAAGLIGGGAVQSGQLAVILGNSAVVNSSSDNLPQSGNLDAMRTNWGPYLWMRCYSNGAQFLDRVVGTTPDWSSLEKAARDIPPGANGITVLPFVLSEPSIGLVKPLYEWRPSEPENVGIRLRASFEAIAYLIGLALREHESAGQSVNRITVSGGIAKSELMCEILASVLARPVHRLVSNEGPALGAAVVALAGIETQLRRRGGIMDPFTAADAVATMVKFREAMVPNAQWVPFYQQGLAKFEAAIKVSA